MTIPKPLRDPVVCPSHGTEHERGDSCHFCLRNHPQAAGLAHRLREHPSAAYHLGEESLTVMLYWAREFDAPALAAALLAAQDEHTPTDLSSLPASMPALNA